MKVKQIVGEHKKGMRAKKYASKPKKYIEPVKPQGPVGPGEDKKLKESHGHRVVVNGKPVDLSSLEVDGVDTRDYPDFSDAYISYGLFADGTEMSDQELELFTDHYSEIVHELAHDSLHEDTSNVTVKPITGAQEIDVNGQKVATATDATSAATLAQLAKDGKIVPTTGNNPNAPTSGSTPMEEGPEVPYYVDTSSGMPMAKTSPRPTAIVASKMWQAITPEIEAKAYQQGFRKVMLQANGRQFPGLEGGDQKLGSKIIVSPNDYTALSGTRTPAVGVKESAELDAMLRIAGLR